MHDHRQQTLRITSTTTTRVSCLQLMLHHTPLPYFHQITNKTCQHADFATWVRTYARTCMLESACVHMQLPAGVRRGRVRSVCWPSSTWLPVSWQQPTRHGALFESSMRQLYSLIHVLTLFYYRVRSGVWSIVWFKYVHVHACTITSTRSCMSCTVVKFLEYMYR